MQNAAIQCLSQADPSVPLSVVITISSVAISIIGALIIMCVTIGLMTVVPPYWQMVAKGGVLIFAVTINHMLARD